MSSTPRKQNTSEVDSASSRNSREKILHAALALIAKRGDAQVTMANIAKAARVSRQAVYLHFADRADLMLALVRHVDHKRGIDAEVQKVAQASSGCEMMRLQVEMQARLNPGLWAVARAFEAVRRTDPAAERAWQDRLENRMRGCQMAVARMAKEGSLKPGLSERIASDLLWTVISLRMWEDLVLQRGWTTQEYEEHVLNLLRAGLTR